MSRSKHGPTQDGPSIALQHALQRWNAETENSQRLSQRETAILTFVAAILGLGLFRLKDRDPIESAWVSTVVRLLLTLALLATARALWNLLLIRLRPSSDGLDQDPWAFASGHLRWPMAPELHPERLSGTKATLIAYRVTTKAANSLLSRNLARKRSIDSGQHWLIAAAFLAGAALLCYLYWVEVSPDTSPQVTR